MYVQLVMLMMIAVEMHMMFWERWLLAVIVTVMTDGWDLNVNMNKVIFQKYFLNLIFIRKNKKQNHIDLLGILNLIIFLTQIE